MELRFARDLFQTDCDVLNLLAPVLRHFIVDRRYAPPLDFGFDHKMYFDKFNRTEKK